MNASIRHATIEDEAIVIYQSTDREGSTFSLSPGAPRVLRQRFGDKLRIAPRIFIAHEARSDFVCVARRGSRPCGSGPRRAWSLSVAAHASIT